jgi:hypothetical protein
MLLLKRWEKVYRERERGRERERWTGDRRGGRGHTKPKAVLEALPDDRAKHRRRSLCIKREWGGERRGGREGG